MSQKRRPQLVAHAKRLRAEGKSYAEIAEALSKKGVKVSRASVHAWLAGSSGSSSPAPQPAPAPIQPPELPPAPPEAHEDLTPDELRGVLANVIRSASRAAAVAEAAGDHAEAKNQRKILGLFTNQLRQIHSKADEDTETVKVKAADMAAAAERAWSGLEAQANAVLAEVERWPRCSGCGQPHGDFAPGADRSRVRALFERVARRAV